MKYAGLSPRGAAREVSQDLIVTHRFREPPPPPFLRPLIHDEPTIENPSRRQEHASTPPQRAPLAPDSGGVEVGTALPTRLVGG